MTTLLDQIRQFFTEDDWQFEQVTGRTILQMGFRTQVNAWLCYARTDEEDEQFAFYSVYPRPIPTEKRAAAAEFITRANFGLPIGNFEMDYDDGELRYKTSVDVQDSSLDQALIRNTVYANIFVMDKYMPGLDQLLDTNRPPAHILQLLEQEWSA